MSSKFEEAVLAHMQTVPAEYTQAIDAIIREMYFEGHSFSFFHFRLKRMVSKGLIRRGNQIRSVFSSYDGTPTYGQATTHGSRLKEE